MGIFSVDFALFCYKSNLCKLHAFNNVFMSCHVLALVVVDGTFACHRRLAEEKTKKRKRIQLDESWEFLLGVFSSETQLLMYCE